MDPTRQFSLMALSSLSLALLPRGTAVAQEVHVHTTVKTAARVEIPSVLYPAAILVGDLLRARQHGKHCR